MKTPIELATELAEYGMYGAGQDCTPEQKEWAADCIESAIIICWQTAGALEKDPPESLVVCGRGFDENALKERAQELREEAKRLKAEEESGFSS